MSTGSSPDMRGVVLPGDRTVRQVSVPVPQPGVGQVLLAVRASSICGSDVRAIYREHLGRGAEAYRGVIAGHEPSGEVVAVGPGCRRLKVGDRVVVYHVAGCGQCEACRSGYLVGCTSDRRAAYGWQRDGGHAQFLLAEESTCLLLPEGLTFLDGALVSCGFGTAYEALVRTAVSGRDTVLVTGLGPVGMAVAMLAKAMGAGPVVGTDVAPARLRLATDLAVVDAAVSAAGDGGPDALEETRARATETVGTAGFSVAVDCSGHIDGRRLALAAAAVSGRCAFVGEGGEVRFEVSPVLIHKQLTLHGSWVTSVGHMADLLSHLSRWGLHPESLVTDVFGLDDAGLAYELAERATSGKVALVPG